MGNPTNQLIDLAEAHLLHTYNRYPVVFDRGEGVRLYDVEGKEYLDFVSGIAVFALGYGDPDYTAALKAQIDKILHTSNYYYNAPMAEAAEKLTAVSGMDRVFFTNSGAEAIEGALKAARKYAYLRDGVADHEIIAMEHSFHGRTMGALSVTGTKKYRDPFEPLLGNIRFAELNDMESVRRALTEKTCAIILEPLQGEGGIHPAEVSFLKDLRALCDERDILLIFDEIQCGMGRTGTMYAFERAGVKPDILTTAKALGCGVPVGAFLLRGKAAEHSLTAGDHGSTYGGNPLACAAVSKVLDLYKEKQLLDHVNRVAPYLEKRLDELAAGRQDVVERRGIGFMQGLQFDHPVAPYIEKALSEGLVLINAGADIIRFLPPLIMTEDGIDEMMDKLGRALS